ncbi:choline monooxygenase [Sarracenia purpurea var. burkii]
MAMAMKPNSLHLFESNKPRKLNPPFINSSFAHGRFLNRIFSSSSCYKPILSSYSLSLETLDEARRLVRQFDPKIPLQEARTPPSSWYTHHSFLSLEFDRVFFRGWQAVGCTEQIKESGDFFTGRLGNVEYVVTRDGNGNVHAFHNVCRHHASILAFGDGRKSCFVCPYHGWTYGLDGALLKATRLTGIRNFNVNEFGLIPLKVAIWGPFVLLNLEQILPQQAADGNTIENEWLGSSSEILSTNGVDSSLSYVCRREYTIECNWKVFCDNYLDGGYHVPYAHKGLASGLKLDSYSTTVCSLKYIPSSVVFDIIILRFTSSFSLPLIRKIFEKVSIQQCDGGSSETEDEVARLGSEALYAFIYPNFMINRYGPWMDTNLVLPLGSRKCQVIFDYFLDASLKDDKAFIERSLEDSERVQMEDIMLCEAVQRGLESPAYCTGRYAPSVEKAMHHFHCLLYENLIS